jgi:uncharacterized protein YjbJ (UPF0337 family)
MADETDDVERELEEIGVPESPATWENVAVGKVKEVLGNAIGDEDLAEAGEVQEAIAHEVREEYRREHPA